jgi:hypothetical protein
LDENLKSKLEKLFQPRQEVVAPANPAEERARKEAEFLTAFLRVRDEVIQPAMSEIAAFVAGKGWSCEIEKGEVENRYPGFEQAPISLVFYRTGVKREHRQKHPHFTVRCHQQTGEVAFEFQTHGPGHGGSRSTIGGYELSEITADFVQSKVGEYIAKLLDVAPGRAN